MSIEPDDKDWTWVLGRRCPECGFDASAFPAESVGAELRANATAWVQLLRAPVAELRRRPRHDRWSPLEYACHVRDVCTLYETRLALMLSEDDPLYPNWGQDATAVERDYLGQEPRAVAAALLAAADSLATAFDGVQPGQWERRGRRGDGASFTVASFSRYLIHDPVHHLWDVMGPVGPASPGAP
ncbi:MAG TPA: DinB family protein [Acidimicrobiales bacterium]